VEVTHTREDQVLYFVLSARPIIHDRRRTFGSIVILTDITERRQEEELRKALIDINLTINSSLDFNNIMQQVVIEAAKALRSDTSAISLRKGDIWKVSYAHGFPSDMVGRETVDEQELHAALAIKTKNPVAINDAYHDERV